MKIHVLLIDERISEIKVFTSALNDVLSSYKCTPAVSAGQAIEMLKYLTPDFIIANLNLPVINGLELLERVKKTEKLQDIPFILYSTHIDKQTNRKAIKLGAVCCFKKPSAIAELVEKLRKIISAESKSEKKEDGKEKEYTRREYSYNSFTRSFCLPDNVKDDSIAASYHDGILQLELPKSEVQVKATKEIPIN
jgi:CheY-like chemotaxis protein